MSRMSKQVLSINLDDNTLKKAIDAVDFSDILAKLAYQYGWKQAHAEEICDMYKNFLFLYIKYGQQFPLAPSEEIDEIWHLHILETQNYRHFCDSVCGQYVDHKPMSFKNLNPTNFKENQQAFNNTLMLYSKEFNGAVLYQIRGPFAKIASFIRKIYSQHKIKKMLNLDN